MSKPSKLRIVAIGGPLEGHEWEFEQDTITFGRSTSNDVSLRDDTTVSRSHATLRWTGEEWELRDDHSANGTHVLENGMRRKLNDPVTFTQSRRFFFGSSEVECRPGPVTPAPQAGGPRPRARSSAELRRSIQISITAATNELIYRVTSTEAVVSEYRNPFSMAEIDDLKQRLRDAVARSYHLRLSGEDARPDVVQPELEQLGDWLKSHCLPRQIRELLQNTRETFITLILDTDLLGVPWELVTLDDAVLCLRFSIGRQIIFKDPSIIKQPMTRVPMTTSSMLIVANPTGDLKEAQRHGEELLNLARRRLPGTDVQFLAGERARKLDILGRLEAADIVYFVGHTEHDPADPRNSSWEVADGKIFAREFERIHPAPRFVFANSCESARESFISGQTTPGGVGGLARAFITAGTLNYVGALWPIAAKQSAYFGLILFAQLLEGLSVGEGVRESRHKCIEHFGLGDPVWAGYVVYGDPTLSPL